MSSGNLLIIHDEQAPNLLKDFLEEEGFRVDMIFLGKEVQKLATENKFDIFIIDSKGSHLDGIKVLEELKKHRLDCPKILITESSSIETVQKALRLGAFDYIAEPFDNQEILWVVRRAAEYHQLHQADKKLLKDIQQQNLILEENIRERVKELSLLYSVTQDITRSLDLETTLKMIVHRVCRVLDVEICSILLWDEMTKALSIKVAQGLDGSIISQTQLKKGDKISGWVLENKEAILVKDIEADHRFATRNNEKYYTHSFISAPLIVKGQIIGVLNVNNKRSRQPFSNDDFRVIQTISQGAAIAIYNAHLFTSLQETYIHTVMALSSAIDAKDHYTKTHSERVAYYSMAMAKELALSNTEIEHIRLACYLHDVGKIAVHDKILAKPSGLTSEEWAEVKLHPLKGAEILRPLTFLKEVSMLVEQHHERYDGKGYPHGLKGEEIKVGARILAIVDTFDAMITKRPYREIPFSKQQALEEIKRNAGSQFDPKLVEVFLKIVDQFEV